MVDKLGLVKSLSDSDLHKFLHAVIDDLCGRKGLCDQEWVPNCFPAIDTLQLAETAWRSYLKNSVNSREKIEISSELSTSQQKIVYSIIDTRKAEIKSAVVDNVLKSSGHRIVRDFDWQVATVLSSDKFHNLDEKLVNLDLRTSSSVSKISNKSNSLSIEMSREELSQFLDVLEEAQTALSAK